VYTVRTDLRVALPADRDVELGSLLKVLVPAAASSSRRRVASAAN
jgi:hypothetical protein